MWMAAREHGGVISADAAGLALPFAIAAFAAAMASRSQTVRAVTAGLLIVFATLGMLTERLWSSPPPEPPAIDAGQQQTPLDR